MTRRDDLIKLRDAVRDVGYATMGHTILCQKAFPKPDDFDGSREAYAKSDAQMAILAWRNDDLNAAKSLHDAVLPGFFWNMGHLDEPSLGYVATVADGHFADSPSWRGYAMIPARAWLLAILEALMAQEPAPMTQEGGE
jgi:hypothetical protein